MQDFAGRRRLLRLLTLLPLAAVGAISGCGGDPEQRKSGTLVVPLDAVEKAGEAAGKSEDSKKKRK